MRRLLLPLLALAVALTGFALAAGPGAAPARASSGQTTFFEAPRDLLDPARRDAAVAELDSLGVKAVRQVLYWKDVAPAADSATKPDFDTTDPASYDWSKYDPVVDAVKAKGWKLLLTVSGPVPRWATQAGKDDLTRPKPSEFAQFMTAVARHYGTQVDVWSIWNEPNQPQFLKPQYVAGKPESPRIYRTLYRAALKAFKVAKVTPTVLFGETSPRGTGSVVAPLTFLRGALCLSASYVKSKACGTLPAAGYAHHAYTTRAGPLFKPSQPNDVTIGVLGRLETALDRAVKAKAITSSGANVYLTEFGIQSRPDPLFGVSYQAQYEFRSISEFLAYRSPQVKAFSQYLLTDDNPVAGVPLASRYPGFESGLRTAGGKVKPSEAAFRLPLVADRRSSSRVSLWGEVRPATGMTTAVVQVRDGATGAFHDLRTVTTDARGVFTASVAYAARRQYQLVWTAPDGTRYAGGGVRAYAL